MKAVAPVMALAGTLVFVVACTGCTTRDDPPVVLPTSSASPAVRDPSATPHATIDTTSLTVINEQVLTAYVGMQRAFEKASAAADPTYPDLARYATGDALKLYTSGLTSMRASGLRTRGETIFHPQVEELEPASAPTKARVRDCMDTRGNQAFKANGDPYKDTPGGFRLVIADLQYLKGTWKVIGVGIQKVGSCTP